MTPPARLVVLLEVKAQGVGAKAIQKLVQLGAVKGYRQVEGRRNFDVIFDRRADGPSADT